MKKKDYLDALKENKILNEQKVKLSTEAIEEEEHLEEFGMAPRGSTLDKIEARQGLKGQHKTGGSLAGAAIRAASFALQKKKWEKEAQDAKKRGERT
jgi:hypothetical protein